MSDDLVKLEWDIRSGGGASVHLPFGSYMVDEFQFSGWQMYYHFDEHYDEGSYSCKDMAEGISLAEEHWRNRVQFITKPLTDRIEELEAKLALAVGHLEKLDRLTASDAALVQAALAELKGDKDERYNAERNL